MRTERTTSERRVNDPQRNAVAVDTYLISISENLKPLDRPSVDINGIRRHVKHSHASPLSAYECQPVPCGVRRK